MVYVAAKKATQTPLQNYKNYVQANSEVPDLSAPKVRATDQKGRKYMLLLGLNDKVAIGQLDSGSHYTVISYEMVQWYGL